MNWQLTEVKPDVQVLIWSNRFFARIYTEIIYLSIYHFIYSIIIFLQKPLLITYFILLHFTSFISTWIIIVVSFVIVIMQNICICLVTEILGDHCWIFNCQCFAWIWLYSWRHSLCTHFGWLWTLILWFTSCMKLVYAIQNVV